MSAWYRIFRRDLDKLPEIHYTKMNVIQQIIADLFMKEQLTQLEVELILIGMQEKEMLNAENGLRWYRAKHRTLLELDRLENYNPFCEAKLKGE
jgi:hypothetical protein